MPRRRLFSLISEFLRHHPVLHSALEAMLFLGLCRVGLMIWQSDSFKRGDLLFILLQGERVDFLMCCALYALPLLLWAASSVLRLRPLLILPLKLYLCFALVLLFLNEAATPSFMAEYGVRPNHLYVEYLKYPKEVFSMLLKGYTLQLIGLPLFCLLLSFGYFRLLSRRFQLSVPLRTLKGAAFYVLCLGLVIPLGIRSSLGHRPFNPSVVEFSSSALANSLPLNSTYSALYALWYLKEDAVPQSMFFAAATPEEVVEAGLALSYRDGQERSTDRHCLFNQRNRPEEARARLTQPYAPRPNVVILLQESFGADYVGSLGGQPTSPNLDRLSQEGWWFTRMYAVGHRSVRGIEGITASFPPSPLSSIVKLQNTHSGVAALPYIYKQAGYTTAFIYGGDAHFDNMSTYFRGNGTDLIVQERDYEQPQHRSSWGVSDEDLYLKAHEIFSKLTEEGKPFFAIVFTSSFHSPFDIPPGKVDLGDYVSPDPKRSLGAKYADYALGKYLEQAKRSSYWDNTIFLIVADHESSVRGQAEFPFYKFHIPALFLGKNLKSYRDDRLVSQIDLPLTLLSLSGLEVTVPWVGQDLNSPEVKERVMMQYFESFTLREGDTIAVLPAGSTPKIFAADDKTKKMQPVNSQAEDLVQRGRKLEHLAPLLYDMMPQSGCVKVHAAH